ncbi:MAG TPA: D-aminoacylase [Gemmatimonadaceae bacterium]|nr:D-aminoacylase [Gemmatimonadaceae bacterium]
MTLRRALLGCAVIATTLQAVAATGLEAQSRPGESGAQPALLVRGGSVLDGSGDAARRLDVRIVGDSIAEVAASIAPRPGDRVVDASGLTVTPGFIDLHSHADRGIEEMPSAESQIRQGITTSAVGQDGGSDLPVSDFLEMIDHLHPAINFVTMIGHGTVRAAVMGADFRRPATAAEIEAMKVLVERGMRDGAVGLSSGTEYDPGFYAEPEEIQALARVVAPFGGYYASHVRDEEDSVLAAWREVIDVGRAAGIPVHISHAKLASSSVWGKAPAALALLDSAERDGVRVTADWYPYTYWSSSIYVVIPDRDFDNRAKWEKGLADIGGAGNILVTSYLPDPSLQGKTIAEIARLRDTDPISTIIEMIHTAGPDIGIIATAMDERDLNTIFADPRVMICSDGSPTGSHPRAFGAFPRVLGEFVRKRHVVPLPEAIAKMTSRPAKLLGLVDRGTIAAGKKADLVIFDPAHVEDRGTKLEPAQDPTGIQYVVVNGELVLDNGRMTAARPGRALRRRTTGSGL